MRNLVTGGAGFIGSHIVDRLVQLGHEVIIYDNLSTGNLYNLDSVIGSGIATFIDGDILDSKKLIKAMSGVTRVFHLAANADVRGGIDSPRKDIRNNILGTHSVLECMKVAGASEIIFTSSATVYGEPTVFPTPESYAPIQTSLYGASKLSAEGIIQAYSEYFGIKNYIFRFVSWLGERYSHGVVFDFVNKLRDNPEELEILGDGKQTKSYLHVDDGIEGIFLVLDKPTKDITNIFNLGHIDYVGVKNVAIIVADEMRLRNVDFKFLGGNRGWIGDSPFVYLDTSKIQGLGFFPKIKIEDAIRRTVRYLLDNSWMLKKDQKIFNPLFKSKIV